MSHKIILYPLLGILIFQITTLSVSLPIPQVTIGAITELPLKVITVAPDVTPAMANLLSLGPSDDYDSVIFVGDIMLGRFVEQLMYREGDDYPFAALPLLAVADTPAIVGNFEASIPAIHKLTPNYQLQFSVPVSALTVLKEAGFSHLSLANNHSYDHGKAGFLHSIEAIEKAGMAVFGSEKEVTGESLTYIETKQGTIALLGVNNSDAAVDTEVIAELLQEATQQSFMQIVYIHWGLEYESIHSRAQKQLATQMVEAGADLIIGHHPHVVQDIDSIQGVPVFYSLGNYIFDQYFSAAVQEGLVLSLEFKEGVGVVRLHPVSSIGRLSQPYLQSDQNRQQFLTRLANTSHRGLSEQIQEGVIQLPLQFATSSKMAMINR